MPREKKHKIIKKTLRTKPICHWTSYKDRQACDSEQLGNLKAGNIIVIIGKVTKSFTNLEKSCGNKDSGIHFDILETRKLVDSYD